MRKPLLLLAVSSLLISTAEAQLSPDGSFDAGHNTWYGNFSYFGKKYVNKTPNSAQIVLYNTDFYTWKTINLNISGYNMVSNIQHISDKLIDTDSLIELVVTMQNVGNNSNYRTYIVNENSDILYDFGANSSYNIGCPPQIMQADGQYKLLIGSPNSFGYTITAFTMPGYLPCETCILDTGVLKTPVISQQQGTILVTDPMPNPSDGSVRIGYTLPKGAERGELVFHNSQGQEVKRINLAQSSATIELNNEDLAAGIYFYHLYSNGKISAGNKMVVQ